MQLNGLLMSADTVVAEVKNGDAIAINEELMPFYLRRASNIEEWLSNRLIDKHRANSRLLKKVLRLTTADDVEIALRVYAATITDNYWFKSEGMNLCYDDIKFKSNMFDNLALYGDPDSFNLEGDTTPELTNTGSFEKCWKIEDGNWWMYKQGNAEELFSELFIYYLGSAMHYNMAHYEISDKYIKSLDFTNQAEVNFEPMHSLIGDDEDYTKNFNLLKEICPSAAVDYVKMIYLDTLCMNMDRHTKNYGVLRNAQTGEVVGLAPNFDNNIALISRGYPKNISRERDRLISLFVEFINQNEEAKEMYANLYAPTGKMIKRCIEQTEMEVNTEYITQFILNGATRLNEQIFGQEMNQGIKME